MNKPLPIRYARTITFGRFNIGHDGHTKLIQLMLEYGEEAHVYVSSGKLNNEWDLRVLLLRVLCRDAGIDLKRVKFLKGNSPYASTQEAVLSAPFNEVAVVLGSDQMEMASKLSEVFDVIPIINRRTNSSTQMRFFLDQSEFRRDLVRLYKNNSYATQLAMILRKEERHREQSAKVAREVA